MSQLITGSNKLLVIRSDGMYNSLHERFRAILKELSELFIIGYSYGDAYLNEIIGESTAGINMVVNVNPYDQFKFTHSNMHQLADIRQLIQFVQSFMGYFRHTDPIA